MKGTSSLSCILKKLSESQFFLSKYYGQQECLASTELAISASISILMTLFKTSIFFTFNLHPLLTHQTLQILTTTTLQTHSQNVCHFSLQVSAPSHPSSESPCQHHKRVFHIPSGGCCTTLGT